MTRYSIFLQHKHHLPYYILGPALAEKRAVLAKVKQLSALWLLVSCGANADHCVNVLYDAHSSVGLKYEPVVGPSLRKLSFSTSGNLAMF